MRSRPLALTIVLLVTLGVGCQTRGIDMPIGLRIAAEVYLSVGKLTSAMVPSLPAVPEGMEVELYHDAGDTTVVGLALDARGDVLLAQSDRQRAGVSDNRFKPYWLLDDLAAEHVDDRRAYIEYWAERGRDPLSWYTRESDKVVRLRDTDGDGVVDRSDELASFDDVLTGIGSSVLVDDETGAIWFTDIPDLYRLYDRDDDGKAEVVETVAHGFGVTTSLAGHDLHGLVWGPDGRIYFSMGDRGYNLRTAEGLHLRPPMVVSRGAVFRIWPDGSGLEEFATGLRNPQDLVFDDFGNLFTGDNNGDGVDEARLVHVVEGGDTGWAMPVQSMEGDYLHGPWEAERLWETHHPGRPAWALPPIGYVRRGPAGAAMDPGLGGLPERFQGKVLVSDYQYAKPRSGIFAYGLEPSGASFVGGEAEEVFGNVLPTDLDFGPDGRIYIAQFDQFFGGSEVHRVANPEHLADPRVLELQQILVEGFDDRSDEELAGLLGHVDRRARRGAQHALARRRARAILAEVAMDERAPLLARVHALWGLGQLGPTGVRSAGIRDLAWTRDAHPEVRAAALKLVGEVRAEWLAEELRVAIADDSQPRLQAVAATALARVGSEEDLPLLVELLRRNDDADPFLRHSAVFALESIHVRSGNDPALRFAADPSPAVRMGVLLVLRRQGDPRVGRYLRDPDPQLVVEAARAVHDLRIAEALPALAGLARTRLPLLDASDRQSTQALHRRVIAANLALGEEENASALAAYVMDDQNPEVMRQVALDALADFVEPPPREPVFGFYRGWPARPPETIHAALDALVPALVGTESEGRALEIALAAGRVPLPDDELLARIESWSWRTPESVKLASLRVLAERDSPDLDRAVSASLASRSPALRAEARDVLAEQSPDAAVSEVLALGGGATLLERQRGYATLARAGTAAADRKLHGDLDALQAGTLDPAVALDLVEAARLRGGPLAAQVDAYERSLPAGDLVTARAIALKGGNADRGRLVFEGPGDCMRCHSVGDGGHGGGRAGPDLRGVAKRHDRRSLLESVVEPQAKIANGYGTIRIVQDDGEAMLGTLVDEDEQTLTIEVKGDRREIPRSAIASSDGPSSGMPPMGLALSLDQLRDLIEYLDTL